MNMKKRGLSTIIVVFVLIAMTLVIGGIVWTVTNSLIKDKMDYSTACSVDLLDQIKIDSARTCYDETNNNMKVFISVGNIENIPNNRTKITIHITYGGNTITETREQEINSGVIHTVDVSGFNLAEGVTPEAVKIAPLIMEQQCNIIDSLYIIPNC
jgi:hypothetical protein